MHILLLLLLASYFPTFTAFILGQYRLKQASTRGIYICGSCLRDYGLKVFKGGPNLISVQIN
jgi:hypothetical protein